MDMAKISPMSNLLVDFLFYFIFIFFVTISMFVSDFDRELKHIFLVRPKWFISPC